MITNNYYQLLLGQVFGVPTNFKDSSGTNRVASYAWTSDYPTEYMAFTDMQDITNIQIGSGTTQPTKSDYTLNNIISKNNLSFSVYFENADNENVLTRTAEITIINNGTTDVTITEVGYMPQKVYKSSYSSGTAARVLIDRTLLDEPLTIPSGDIGKLIYTINLDLSEIYNEIETQ